MGLNLRKLKDAAFAQINPFDGGKTASTVWNNTPVGYKDQAQTIRPTGLASRNGTIYIDQQARQASQARPQQSFIPGNQKKPSGFMGALNAAIDSPLSPVSVGKEVFLGNGPLGYLGKATSTGPLAKPTQGIRDTLFDANTAKDIAKRNQAELAKAQMAKANGQVYTPKLNQTYMEQQASLGRRGRNNFGDQMVGGFAENLNTVGAKLYETPETLRGTVAASTGNQEALRMSLERQKKNAQMLYGKNSGGLLNTGTIYDSPEQTMNLSAGDTAKRVFGGQLEAASMVVGGGALPSIAKSGLKGLASYGGKTFASGAMGLGGNEMSTNPNASAMDIVKQSALGGVFGLGLGVAGDAAVKGVGMGVKAIKPKVELTKVNQQGSIDPAQAFKNIRDKLNGSALDTTVKPATPENVYGVNALEKLGKKLKMNQGGGAKAGDIIPDKFLKDDTPPINKQTNTANSTPAKTTVEVDSLYDGGKSSKDGSDLYGTPDGYKYTVEMPSQKDVETVRTKRAEYNANGSGFSSTKSDIVVKDEDGDVVRIIDYDKAVEKYGATDPEKLANLAANQGVEPATPKPVVKAAPPTEPNVVKSEVTKKKGFNDFVDEIAQSQGIETKYNAPEMFTFNKVLNKVSGGKMQNLMQISPARLASQKVEDKVASVAQKANVSRKGSKTLNTSRTMFAQTGISDADKMANRRFRDSQSLASDLTKGEMKISDDLASKLADPEKSLDNVYRVIADQKILERTHGKGARLKTKDLTPEEQTIANRIIDAQKRTNEINYRIGRITKEQYDAEKATGHYARMFNIESKGGKQLGKKPIDTMPFQERKDPAEFSDSLMELFIKDPFRGALARQEIAMRSLASHEFMGELVKQGRLLDRKPNKGFQQLNGKKYGKYDGMWADNTTRTQIKQNMEFESDWAKKYVGQLLDDYKSNVMGKTQRVLKATKTVLNPGTNVQNIMSNILFFNRGSGVGVIRNATGMARAAKDLAKAKGGKLNAELIQAKKLGVFGNDSGKAMVGDIGAESLASMPDKKNVIMKGLGVAEDIYGGTDNAAKLGLWRNLQKKGLSPEDAAKQVQKFTQDYHNVGRIVGAMADAPVLGKPFARFIPELVRLTKNNLAYNPAGTIAGLAAIAYAGNALSEKAGETDEERANREGVIGNTSLPGTRYINKALGGPDRDISLNFAVGNSSVNIARAVGLNFPSEPGQDPNRALLEQLLPFEIPTRKDAQGNEVFDGTKIVTHLGLRPIIETVADRNFMGQSIKDPENKVRVEGSELGKTYTGDVSKGEKTKNVASHLARAYLPMGNEIDSLVAAFKGEPNAMGKERTPMQAALRTVGVKVEKNDQAARDKRASTKEFFDGKLGQVNDFLNKNPDLKEQYLSIKSGTKDRSTGKKVVDLVGPEKWQKITGDKSGRLFDQMKAEDEYQNKQDPTYPIDPIFSNQLSKEQRNQLLEIRSSYSGSNIEQEEILRATKPWYQNFEAAERDANTKKSAYFDKLEKEGKLKNSSQNERVKAYGDLYDKYSPQQTPLMTKYYQLKDSNPDAAKALFSTNPELSDQFDAYKEQKLKYINEKRKIEGVPAIDRNTFMNVTFGYEDDERKVFNELKYGRGYGSYSKGGYSRRGGGSGGGGSGDGLASEYDNPYKYAVSIKAKGSSKATVKLGGKIAKRGVTAKATSKPKVTIKKSTA